MQFSSFRRKLKNAAGRFNLVLVVVFLPGVALLYWFPSGFWHSFGEAVLIAALLGGFVDYYLKRRILREASLDISKFLLGYALPPEVQNQISCLMQTTLLRRNFEVEYAITRVSADRCLLRVQGFFLVENFTNTPQRYKQGLGFERGEEPHITELRLDTDDEKSRYCLREGGGLTVKEVCRAEGPERLIEPKAWGKSYKFGYRYSIEFPSSYPDILAFEHITSGVVVRIIAPPDMEAYADVDSTCEVSDGRYEYKRVFLPAQHIRIRWKAKE